MTDQQAASFRRRRDAFRSTVIAVQEMADKLTAAYTTAVEEADRAAVLLSSLVPEVEKAQAICRAQALSLNAEADRLGQRADLVVPDVAARVRELLEGYSGRLTGRTCTCGGAERAGDC